MEELLFSSKAITLKLLKKNIKKSKIQKLYYFNVNDWMDNPKSILQKIQTKFSNSYIIVRSSALDEDSLTSSRAGYYDSVLNVNSKSKQAISSAINHVINSYKKSNNSNQENQILVQEQAKNITYSGVLFTKTPNDGKPYYVVNYEHGSSTNSVTQGEIAQSIKIFKKINPNLLPKHWNLLIKSVREIEKFVKNDNLDIEFGITKKFKIIIFQVRPLVLQIDNDVSSIQIQSYINSLKNSFNKNLKNQFQKNHKIFSDMTDWNPAEIIGNTPRNLDYSLYDYIIMKSSWQEGRSSIGYTKIKNTPLMKKFGNKAYVDVEKSFKSLIPKNINKNLKNKLVNYYIEKLEKYPYLHDKAEFEILFTCYDFSIKKKLSELKKSNFSKNEIEKIEKNLLDFTNEILQNFPKISHKCDLSINHLKKNRKKIFAELYSSKQDYHNLLIAAEKLLDDCKDHGAKPFSTMARLSFIASTILKSLVGTNLLSKENNDEFMQSIETPLSKFQNDVIKFQNKKMTKVNFLKKYGHLRPGTYDITTPRYENNHQFLENLNLKHIPPKSNLSKKNKLKKIFKQNNLEFSKINIFDFIEQAITGREELKFLFTKNLSDSLELIAEAGKKLNFSRDDLSYLDIKSILKNHHNYEKTNLIKYWKNKINTEKNKFTMYQNLELPPLITSKKDFEIITYPTSEPNYVTNKKISSYLILPNEILDNSMLENKIVLLENADPGYDWIFSYNLSGLITKYGGVASHMAIRCAEIGLPAAIGCGEIIYENLYNSSKVLLDCKNHQILILENKTIENFTEEKLILKSLGYIK